MHLDDGDLGFVVLDYWLNAPSSLESSARQTRTAEERAAARLPVRPASQVDSSAMKMNGPDMRSPFSINSLTYAPGDRARIPRDPEA